MIDIVEPHHRIQSTCRVAVVGWSDPDENALAICHELEALGHQTRIFLFDQTVPEDVEIVLTFAPLGKWRTKEHAKLLHEIHEDLSKHNTPSNFFTTAAACLPNRSI